MDTLNFKTEIAGRKGNCCREFLLFSSSGPATELGPLLAHPRRSFRSAGALMVKPDVDSKSRCRLCSYSALGQELAAGEWSRHRTEEQDSLQSLTPEEIEGVSCVLLHIAS